MRLIAVPLIGLVFATTAAHAEDRREHGAHEHGHVAMQVVLEGAVLAINVEAPGMDIVGFERVPKNAAEKTRIREAVDQLENAAAMFALPDDAGCSVTEAHAEHDAIQEHDHAHHKDKHEREESSHSAFHAHYAWRCEVPAALKYVDVRHFITFPATAEIEALVVSPNGQSAQELTATSTQIKF